MLDNALHLVLHLFLFSELNLGDLGRRVDANTRAKDISCVFKRSSFSLSVRDPESPGCAPKSLFANEAIQASRVEFTGGQWPPVGIEVVDPWHLPLYNTVILLLSGTCVTWAHHAMLHNDRKGLVSGLVLTVLLGILFSFVQAYEYIHSPFDFKNSIYGATFFMATGFHGFHVLVGTIFLIVCLFRAMAGHFTPQQHFGFEAAAWYWHFVDVVWLFLFFAIYIWGDWGARLAH